MFSLTFYKRDDSANPATTGPSTAVKTTMIRTIANPRRTTLAHLADAEGLHIPQQPEHSVDLPAQTANPRRTILETVPVTAAAQ